MKTELYNVHKKQLVEACEYALNEHLAYNEIDPKVNSVTPFNHAYNKYKSEVYPHSSVIDWLQGLVLNVKHYYFNIANMFMLSGLETSTGIDYLPLVTDNYWRDMAHVLISEWKKEGLDVGDLS